ncbi:hypothetical protein MMC22_007436 [Lobaria immixta]|nr:hypothetical protein [Lobaria immixta]
MAPSDATQSAFDRAWEKFSAGLSAKELKTIKAPTTLDSVIETAKKITEEHERKDVRKTVQVFERLDKARAHLEPFNEILKGVCELPPNGGSLLWASVNLTLQFVKDNNDSFEAVLSFFAAISQKISLFESLTNTFGQSTSVVPVVEDLYVALIGFWVEAVKHYRAKALEHLFRVIRPSTIKRKFDALKADLEKHEDTLIKVSAAQHYSDDGDTLKEEKENKRRENRERVKEWIGAPSYRLDFRKALEKRYGTTCEWILKQDKYRLWAAAEHSAFLVIYGKAGCGKTILSSFLINCVNPPGQRDRPKTPSLSLYHYFKLNDETKNEPLTAIRSMLQQLYDQIQGNDDSPAIEKALLEQISMRVMDFDDLWDFFSDLISKCSLKVNMALDAMDECKRSKGLGEHLEELADEKEIIKIGVDDVKSYIASFVRFKVDKIERLQPPGLKTLKDDVVRALTKPENHQGMFLWAYLMCKDLKMLGEPEAIRRLMERLPKELEDVYVNILERLDTLPLEQKSLSQLVLQWIVASDRPIQFSELEQGVEIGNPELIATFEVVSSDDEDQSASDNSSHGKVLSSRKLVWSRKDIVRVCGSLVAYSGMTDGDSIGLIHLTTRDFLASTQDRLTMSPTLEIFLVNTLQTKTKLVRTCLKLLNSANPQRHRRFKDKEKCLTPSVYSKKFRSDFALFDYAVQYWPTFLIDIMENPGNSVSAAELQATVSEVENLVQSGFAVTWVAEYIQLYDPESALNIARRLRKQKRMGSALLLFSNDLEQMVESFSRPILDAPYLVHKLLPRGENNGLETQEVISIDEVGQQKDFTLRIEHGLKLWTHYDPRLKKIFFLDERLERLQLKCQNLESSTKFRPIRDEGWPILPEASFDMIYLRTVLWHIDETSNRQNKHLWAEISIIEDVWSSSSKIFDTEFPRATNFVNFGKHDTLIAPGGIWSITEKQIIARPAAIFDPDPALEITQTCFSSIGAARVSKNCWLEVLTFDDNQGRIVWRHKPSTNSTDVTHIHNFSSSGEKLLIETFKRRGPKEHELQGFLRAPVPRTFARLKLVKLVCFIIEEPYHESFELSLSVDQRYSIGMSQFTKDEKKLVARMDDPKDRRTIYGIVVWSIAKENGKYPDQADMVHLFKDLDGMSFSTIPRSLESKEGLLIATSSGDLYQRSFDEPWSMEEEESLEALETSWVNYEKVEVIKDVSELVYIALAHDESYDFSSNLAYEESYDLSSGLLLDVRSHSYNLRDRRMIMEFWSLGDKSIKRSQPEVVFKSRTLPDTTLTFSKNGRFMAAGSEIFHISNNEARSLQFSSYVKRQQSEDYIWDEERIVLIQPSVPCTIISFFDATTLPTLTKLATYRIPFPSSCRSFNMSFCGPNLSLFAYSYQQSHAPSKYQGTTMIARIMDGDVQITQINEKYLFKARVSDDAKYVYPSYHPSGWPSVYESGFSNELASVQSTGLSHLTMVIDKRPNFCYAYGEKLLRIRIREEALVYLDHNRMSHKEQNFRSRLICILPTRYLEGTRKILLLPSETAEDDEIKFLLLSLHSRSKCIIRTGIRSKDLFNDDAWLISEPWADSWLFCVLEFGWWHG